jgi:hypothetical protein
MTGLAGSVRGAGAAAALTTSGLIICRSLTHKSLILLTAGGGWDADVAFRVASELQIAPDRRAQTLGFGRVNRVGLFNEFNG